MAKYDCEPCENLNLEVKQTLFLGLTVVGFDTSLGWNTNTSTLSVVLIEDTCPGPKCCYNECMQEVSINEADLGFFGDNRYERADGSRYSICTSATPENPTDTLVFAGTDLVGSPAFFRLGEFEWCGIIIDWTKDESCDGGLYRVKLADPRTILEGVYLITGEYSGCVDQFIPVIDGGTGCPEANVFNVYGYMEQFGNCCPPVVQCGDKTYQTVDACPANQISIDGTVFGTPLNGFGGSFANAEGMPWGTVQLGFNLLANSTPANMNCHSPYGRVCFCSSTVALENSGCGLMAPDIGPGNLNPCLDNKDFYYIDLSHLSQFVHPNYRIPGPVTSVADLINQLSQDFNFDYYVDLVPFVTGAGAGCATKVIKVYAVNRNVRPNLDVLCQFIEDTDCVIDSSYGRELRNENTSKFVIGGRKKFVYQIGDDTNPDGGDTCDLTSIDSLTGAKRTGNYTPRETASVEVLDPCSFSFPSGMLDASGNVVSGIVPSGSGCNVYRTPLYDCIDVSGYPYINGTTCSAEYDDVVVPYFGLDYNGDVLVASKDSNGDWFFDAPVAEIQSSLMEVNFGGLTHIRIGELEMRAALEGYDDWQSFAMNAVTESSRAIGKDNLPFRSIVPAVSPLVNGESLIPRDFANPSINKFKAINDDSAQRYIDDLQKVYEWIANYAKTYYGRQFAVRVPFTCCWWDADNQQVRMSECPTNQGGWTEEDNVLGLVNQDPNREGQFDFLNYFRNDQGQVTPFVRYDKGILKSISNLGKDDYLIYYEVPTASLGAVTVDQGPPQGPPTGGDPAIWIDEITGVIYVWINDNNEWRPITDTCIFKGEGVPNAAVQIPQDCFGVYLDTNTCQLYANNTATPGFVFTDGEGFYTSGSWIPIDFFLYVKAQVEEEYVFADKSNCWGPRIVVSVPQSVNLREEDPQYIRGISENISALVNSRPNCASGIMVDISGETDRIFGNGTSSDAWFGIHEKACIPSCFAIPMESKNISYGPWYNPSEGCGRTDVVQDESLVPWNFGSYQTMNAAAQFLVDNARADMKAGELGKVCLPGTPTLPLGAELGAVNGGYYGGGSYLVENRSLDDLNFSGTNGAGNAVSGTYQNWNMPAIWTGLYGPNITNISVTGGCDSQTCYTMRTFSPPRNNGLAKWTLEQLQKLRNSVNYQTKRIKDLIEQNEQLAFARSFFNESDKRDRPKGQIQNPGGNNSIVQANIVPWKTKDGDAGFTRPFAGNITSDQMSEQIQHNYDSTAYMSQDGFYRPVSLEGDGGLPRFAQCDTTGLPSGTITISDLNPLQNPCSISGTYNNVTCTRSDTSGIGHDVDIVGRSQCNGAVGQGSLSIDGYDTTNNGDYASDYRFPAMKGPMVLQGWGYDCAGNPVPNKNDTEENASSGIFIPSGLDSQKFLDGHLRKSHTWPVGPVDFRWDHTTCTWKAASCSDGIGDLKCYVATEDIAISASGGIAVNCEGGLFGQCSDSGITAQFTAANESCCSVSRGDKVLTVIPSGTTTPEIVCSFPNRVDVLSLPVKILSQKSDCMYEGAIKIPEGIGGNVDNADCPDVVDCPSIRSRLVKVWIRVACPDDEFDIGSIINATKVEDCFDCGGDERPLFIQNHEQECCPFLDGGGGLPLAGSVRASCGGQVEVINFTLCWHECVFAFTTPDTGAAVEGTDHTGPFGAWIGRFSCNSRSPLVLMPVAVRGSNGSCDPGDVGFAVISFCGGIPTWTGRIVIDDNGDYIEASPSIFCGPVDNDAFNENPCLLWFQTDDTYAEEVCSYDYAIVFECDGNINDGFDGRVTFYHVYPDNHPTLHSLTQSDLDNHNPPVVCDLADVGQINYISSEEGPETGSLCLNTVQVQMCLGAIQGGYETMGKDVGGTGKVDIVGLPFPSGLNPYEHHLPCLCDDCELISNDGSDLCETIEFDCKLTYDITISW